MAMMMMLSHHHGEKRRLKSFSKEFGLRLLGKVSGAESSILHMQQYFGNLVVGLATSECCSHSEGEASKRLPGR